MNSFTHTITGNEAIACPQGGGLRRRGISSVYVLCIASAVIGVVSLGVEVGRVQTAKTELQSACDSSARYGAAGIKNVLYGQSGAYANAAAAARENNVDGRPLVLDPNQDIEIGTWSGGVFTNVVDPLQANAVRVTGRLTNARSTAVPLLFMSVLRRTSVDISARATAVLMGEQTQDIIVSAKYNPFLAGAAPNVSVSNGNPHNNPDWSQGTVGKTDSSPPLASAITLSDGASLSFDGINGNANYDPNAAMVSADGDTGYVVSNLTGDEQGISNMNAPINCLVGVFLTDNAPSSGSTPANLDFSSPVSRDFTTLNPQLKQIFFIGDGRTSLGEVQHFVVPNGATRLYIATWDGWEWNNNSGSFGLTVHNSGSIKLVK